MESTVPAAGVKTDGFPLRRSCPDKGLSLLTALGDMQDRMEMMYGAGGDNPLLKLGKVSFSRSGVQNKDVFHPPYLLF